MGISREEVQDVLESSGLQKVRQTKKVAEYRSPASGQVLYFRHEIGLPEYVRVVIHPGLPHGRLTAIEGVAVNEPKEFQHGSNMTAFPKRKNQGADEIHYGRALNVSSLEALQRLAVAFATK